ncbi:hypothetical protein GR212_18495 [Rhizobium lusitanum]|uniref:Uncharacterized protein n=1 Tax=Rhizobium lusitanum TaxID=293958 RepID=A0A6L9U849_9HYPH|nr:hypothetical protein [Rhizobium lusitanum]NEI71574.1 hypothetical protein [Rhizobium lusitanum]
MKINMLSGGEISGVGHVIQEQRPEELLSPLWSFANDRRTASLWQPAINERIN